MMKTTFLLVTRTGWIWLGMGGLLVAGIGMLWYGQARKALEPGHENPSVVEAGSSQEILPARTMNAPLDQDPPDRSRATHEERETTRNERCDTKSHSSLQTGLRMQPDAPQPATRVTTEGRQLIGLKIEPVMRRSLDMTIRAVGRVAYDEQRITRVNLRFSGWVEHLFVGSTGQRVRRGQPLLTVYSPELVAAQDEYLLALEAYEEVQASPLPEVRAQARQLLEAARDRLRFWNITDAQIEALVRQGRAHPSVTVHSPIEGYVIEKTAVQGLFVEPRTTLYAIADLSSIWVLAELYEYEVPFVTGGESATLTFDAYPGETFSGTIDYIYPYVSSRSRTLKVRLEFANPAVRLKPDMFGTVVIRVQRKPALAVPAEAVIDTGTRTVVFVAKQEGLFEPRVVTLGPKVGAYYEVKAGLREGDQVVTSGNFLLDSESRLMASTSMMGALGMGGIKMEQAQMGEMDMGDMHIGEMKMGKTDQDMKKQSEQEDSPDEVINASEN